MQKILHFLSSELSRTTCYAFRSQTTALRKTSFDYKDNVHECCIITNVEEMLLKMGVKFRGVSRIGTGGVIRLRQTYIEPHVG